MDTDSPNPVCECNASSTCILHGVLEDLPHAFPSDPLALSPSLSQTPQLPISIELVPETPSPLPDEVVPATPTFQFDENEIKTQNQSASNSELRTAPVGATEIKKGASGAKESTALTFAKHAPTSLQQKEANIPDDEISREAKNLLGRRIPVNTDRSTRTALSIFSVFYAKHQKLLYDADVAALSNTKTPLPAKQRITENAISLTRQHLFRDRRGRPLPNGYDKWEDWQLHSINNALIEFVAHYRQARSGEELAPGTLKVYVAGIQRAFREDYNLDLDLLRGHIFSDKQIGLYCALDNKVKERQAAGAVRQSHNNLSLEDLKRLYSSEQLSKNTPKGFMVRILVDLLLITAFRKSELWSLRMKDVTRAKQNGMDALRIVGQIGSRDGSSKTQRGGLHMVNVRPKEVFVFDMDVLDDTVNIYNDLCHYLDIVAPTREAEDRFLAAIDYRASTRAKFFKKGNLGVNSIYKYVTDACNEVGIRGEGVFDHVTTHSFRATVVSQLKANGFDDSSVALRTGNRDMRSLKAYHNLRGNMGVQQQAAIFGSSVDTPSSVGNDGGSVHRAEVSKACVNRPSVRNDNTVAVEVLEDCDNRNERSAKRQRTNDVFTAIGNMSGQITVNINYYHPRENEEKKE